MADFKEFDGRDFDECVVQAVEWFNCSREMLEIDFIQDAKAGFLGIVGGRKAKIRARRAPAVGLIHGNATLQSLEDPRAAEEEPHKRDEQAAADRTSCDRREAEQGEEGDEEEEEGESSRWPSLPLDQLDREKLKAAALEVTANIIRPLAGRDVEMDVDLEHGRPHIIIHWEGDAGLLIGREGQTLIALQYIISRILSRIMKATLRAQLDIGDYRTRQDSKLRALAFSLAEKARRSGKPLSTRPLSSYHRRIIHMSLQKFPDIQTRSSGEGPLKRVVISTRRH